jgi:hypothetical protein
MTRFALKAMVKLFNHADTLRLGGLTVGRCDDAGAGEIVALSGC